MSDITDPRHLANGWEIPTETYSDQPYVVKTDDGAWLCVLTTGPGVEGQRGQHVVTLRSTDLGRTWSDPVAVEPGDGPEASYAVLLKVPGGRVYCFYNHNTDNVRECLADDPPFPGGKCWRVDSLGHFVMKYSDDHGRTWSDRRYDLDVREMDIDRSNPYKGELRYFWNVGKPFIHDGAAYVSLHKVGRLGEGFFVRSEGVLLRSSDLLTERDPQRITWETLPDGDFGLRTPPGGSLVAEEQSYVVLSDGSFCAVYRSVDGHPVESYSRDGGRTWETPQYRAFADGRPMKHPRAANFQWKCSNGKYLYWFHNHGGRDYEDRNPAWLCGGIEADGPTGRVIRWSQPEIVLYDDDTFVRMSYPDLVEEGGRYYLTETQKDIARVHEVDAGLLAGLWAQLEGDSSTPGEALLGELRDGEAMPSLPVLLARDGSRADHGTRDLRAGLALELGFRLVSLAAERMLLDTRGATGQGLAVYITARGTIAITLNDGRTECAWDCDAELLQVGREHNLVIIVDGGPKLILFVVDGRLCDGGEARQFGWGRYSPHLREANATETRLGWGHHEPKPADELAGRVRLAPEITLARAYGRALRVSEAVALYREQGGIWP